MLTSSSWSLPPRTSTSRIEPTTATKLVGSITLAAALGAPVSASLGVDVTAAADLGRGDRIVERRPWVRCRDSARAQPLRGTVGGCASSWLTTIDTSPRR